MVNELAAIPFDVTKDAIRACADITDDYNPLHLDDAFAEQTPMKGVIAHGTMSLSLIWQSLTETFGIDRMQDVSLSIRFKKPVRPGDKLTARGQRREDSVTGYVVWVENQRGERVIEGKAEVRSGT
jgi:3-hydroxybutyryl-CoA dehydratase